jgi:hypothetical protein
MKCKFGALVTEGSGSIGGHTIQHSKGGMQMRNKPIPRNLPSGSQYLIRSNNSLLHVGWHSLTDAQRQAWNGYASVHFISNNKGEKHALSGQAFYFKAQGKRQVAGLPWYTDPSQYTPNIFGDDIVINGTFDSSDNWELYGFWTISGGKAHYINTASSLIRQVTPITASQWVRLSFEISNCPGNTQFKFFRYLGGSLFKPPYDSYFILPNGSYSYYSQIDLVSTGFYVYAVFAGDSFDLDNLSMRPINWYP